MKLCSPRGQPSLRSSDFCFVRVKDNLTPTPPSPTRYRTVSDLEGVSLLAIDLFSHSLFVVVVGGVSAFFSFTFALFFFQSGWQPRQ